ncbi:hypothetical protein V1509DRAFT_562920, partial [Lipomyces kononenkoae]
TYANGIHAMSTVTVPEDSNLGKVGPPNTRRPPGRPDKKRNRTEDIGIRSKRVTCSRRGIIELLAKSRWEKKENEVVYLALERV